MQDHISDDSSPICLKGGTLHDPCHGVDGVVTDLWIEKGRVVKAPLPSTQSRFRVIELSGRVVMPGGVDLHSHIAGPKVNAARKMLPEIRRREPPWPRQNGWRSGTTGPVPSTFVTGSLYSGLGYTFAVDAAIPPLAARHVHEEFEDTPQIDKAFLLLCGNNHFVMEAVRDRDSQRLKAFLGWLLHKTGGWGLKVVNPGGVEVWKQNRGTLTDIDSRVPGFDVSPRMILQGLASAADELGLPHPIHIHANNLGLAGNWETTRETMLAFGGHRGHLTHIQFHSYGGDPHDPLTFHSKVAELVAVVEAHPELTIDVGQVLFGKTVSMTGDGPLGWYLHRVLGGKWFSGDLELESGCGIVPVRYQPKSLIHAWQWVIGLEWFLLMKDPWKVALTTDHPNGASFVAYPEIIALLMDRDRRQRAIAQLPPGVRDRCELRNLDREYSLQEIAIITRAAPARILGLQDVGHLGEGARGDVAVYSPNADRQAMFAYPELVLKRGNVLIEGGELRQMVETPLIQYRPDYDMSYDSTIEAWIESQYTLSAANFPVSMSHD